MSSIADTPAPSSNKESQLNRAARCVIALSLSFLLALFLIDLMVTHPNGSGVGLTLGILGDTLLFGGGIMLLIDVLTSAMDDIVRQRLEERG